MMIVVSFFEGAPPRELSRAERRPLERGSSSSRAVRRDEPGRAFERALVRALLRLERPEVEERFEFRELRALRLAGAISVCPPDRFTFRTRQTEARLCLVIGMAEPARLPGAPRRTNVGR
jgi:hypothetical protein